MTTNILNFGLVVERAGANVLTAITQQMLKENGNARRPLQCGKAIETANADIQSISAMITPASLCVPGRDS